MQSFILCHINMVYVLLIRHINFQDDYIKSKKKKKKNETKIRTVCFFRLPISKNKQTNKQTNTSRHVINPHSLTSVLFLFCFVLFCLFCFDCFSAPLRFLRNSTNELSLYQSSSNVYSKPI